MVQRLAEELPNPTKIAEIQDIGDQARATLAILIDQVATSVETPKPIPPDPLTCPNCGAPVSNAKTPYCSECCREQAAFVRQIRTGLQNDSVYDRDRQIAFGQALWHLLGAGRPLRESLLSEKDRARIFKRENGLCQICRAPAVTIENTGSG